MAYIVYFACDCCGKDAGGWVNHTVSLSVAQRVARKAGWRVGKRGWLCPECQKKNKGR